MHFEVITKFQISISLSKRISVFINRWVLFTPIARCYRIVFRKYHPKIIQFVRDGIWIFAHSLSYLSHLYCSIKCFKCIATDKTRNKVIEATKIWWNLLGLRPICRSMYRNFWSEVHFQCIHFSPSYFLPSNLVRNFEWANESRYPPCSYVQICIQCAIVCFFLLTHFLNTVQINSTTWRIMNECVPSFPSRKKEWMWF